MEFQKLALINYFNNQAKKPRSTLGNPISYRKFANSFSEEECIIFCATKRNIKSN